MWLRCCGMPGNIAGLVPLQSCTSVRAERRGEGREFKSVTLCCNLEHVVGLQANTIADA